MAWPRAKVVLKVSQVPDWGRRAIRLSLALCFFTTLALTLWPVPESLREEWGDEVRQSCNWAGASCAVVAASPLIGKVAQLSYERTLGTLTGGLLGFMVYDYGVLMLSESSAEVLMVVSVAAVGFLSCWLSYKFNLDASMRLFVITFLIVMFGGGTHSALGVALLRTGGIICGVLLFMGLTIIILPKSATIEALREMKSSLKLLTELNTLVWTSKQEATAAMKAAADKARAAEVAAAQAAAAKAAGLPTAAGLSVRGSGTAAAVSTASAASGAWQRLRLSVLASSLWRPKPAGYEYHTLPGEDPETGMVSGRTAELQQDAVSNGISASVPARHAQGSGVPHASQGSSGRAQGVHHLGVKLGRDRPKSQLTEALLQGQSSPHATHQAAASTEADGTTAATAVGEHLQQPDAQPQQQHQQQQRGQQHDPAMVQSGHRGQGDQSYKEVTEKYEEKCECVLTAVYQSMFKVKEHVQLSNSEVYVFHFFGHYLFLPMFFNNALFEWCMPNRWKLPVKELEEMSTCVRTIARLLWTVHLDYSQQSFDEVIQALPLEANMSNLLQELGEAMSAALGVLVEAFPNKEAVLVDKLKSLRKLVFNMVAIGAVQHAALIQDLAASRPTARPGRTDSSGGTHTPTFQMQQQHQQVQRALSPLGRAAGPSPFYNMALADGAAAPAASAVTGSSAPAPATPAQELDPAAHMAIDTQAHGATTATVGASGGGAGGGNGQLVPFVTFEDSSSDEDEEDYSVRNRALVDSWTLEGLPPPVRTESPVLWGSSAPSPRAAAAAGATSTSTSASPAAAAGGPESATQQEAGRGTSNAALGSLPPISAPSAASQLMFELADSPAAAPDDAMAADTAAVQSSGPSFRRFRSFNKARSSSLASSLVKAHFRPFGKVPALRLNKPSSQCSVAADPEGAAAAIASPTHAAGQAGQAARAPAATAATYANMRTQSAPSAACPDGPVLPGGLNGSLITAASQQQQQQEQTAASAPHGAVASVNPGDGAGAGPATVGSNEVPTGWQDPEAMNFVKLTRWYSFQFLMLELLREMDDLYNSLRGVLDKLPHGL